MTTNSTAQFLTDADIRSLRTEAAAAGDNAQVELCDQALCGDMSARLECERVVVEAALARREEVERD
jgi:hypothetical protein